MDHGGSDSLTTADIIAQRLFAAGCRYAFGIPGGEVLVIVDALRRAGIEFVVTKHENSAGFIGEGVHHATGAPVVLVATIGPGMTNAVNFIANALQDRVPVVLLTGCVGAAEALTYTHQVIDHQAVLRPIVKATFRVAGEATSELIDKALRIAVDGQPGPVHIDIPVDVAGGREQASPLRRVYPTAAAPAESDDLAEARVAFGAAERPLMIVGVDVLNQNVAAEVASFAERYGIPVLTTYKAKGVLPEDHPLAIAGAGLSPKADRVLLPLVAASDLIILAGYDPIEMRTGWRNPWPDGHKVIELAAVANTHFMHCASWSFVGDVAAGLTALARGVTPRPVWPDGEPARVRAAHAEAFSAPEAWGPGQVFATVRATLPRNTIATADSGAHRILLSQMWQCFEPRGLLQSTGFCTMGCAVPLAMGRKLAEPSRKVVAFVGDGGLEMILGELATARDLGLAIIVVVLVDGALALIELKQRAMGLPPTGIAFGRTDFPAVAQALGGHGEAVESAAELAQALTRAMAASTFTVIACALPDRAYDGTF